MNYLVIDLEMCKVPKQYRRRNYKYAYELFKLSESNDAKISLYYIFSNGLGVKKNLKKANAFIILITYVLMNIKQRMDISQHIAAAPKYNADEHIRNPHIR